MSECEQTSRASAYHDGALSPAGGAEFEAHCRRCRACAGELEQVRKLSGLLGSLPPEPMPAETLARLHRAADRLPATGIVRMSEVLAAVAAIILAVCVAGLVNLGSSRGGGGGLPLWETQAVAAQPAESTTGGSEELVTCWMARDLSGRGGHD